MRTGLTIRRLCGFGACIALAFGIAACRPDDDAPVESVFDDATSSAVVEFPPGLHAADPAVNTFLTEAVETCAAEDYEGFRLLWSAQAKPMTEPEFRRGWRATRKVTILGLEKRRDPRDEAIVYVVHGRVELDPKVVTEADREIVLLLVQEDGRWRLAHAPRKTAQALKEAFKNRGAVGDAVGLDSNGLVETVLSIDSNGADSNDAEINGTASDDIDSHGAAPAKGNQP